MVAKTKELKSSVNAVYGMPRENRDDRFGRGGRGAAHLRPTAPAAGGGDGQRATHRELRHHLHQHGGALARRVLPVVHAILEPVAVRRRSRPKA